MAYWYSPSLNNGCGGFGLISWGSKKRPADAVNISAEEHASLFPPGEPQREIETGPDGKPRWKLPSIDEQRAAAMLAVKAEAKRRIEAVMPLHRQFNAIREGKTDAVGFARIDAVRTASAQIKEDIASSDEPSAIPITTHPYWPEFEAMN